MDTKQIAPGKWSGNGLELMGSMSVAIDPNNSARWWLGYDDMGLWRTDDGGVSFSQLDLFQDYDPANPVDPQNNNVIGSDAVSSIIVDPADGNTIYAGRNGGSLDADSNWAFGFAYKSTDAGATWIRMGSAQLSGGRPELLMLPGGTPASRTLFAAIYGKGLFRSADSGNTWVPSDSGISTVDRAHIWSLAYDPSNSHVLYSGIADATLLGGSQGGIYKSVDGGVTWVKLGSVTAPVSQVLDLDVSTNGTVFAATTATFSFLEPGSGTGRGGLYRSADGGLSWILVLAQPRIEAVSVNPLDATQVIAAASSYWNFMAGNSPGIYRSRDGGLAFTKESDGLTHSRFWFAAYGPGGRVFAGTAGGGLFVSSSASLGSGMLDVDGSGVSDASDGVMILRKLNGGQTVVTGVVLPAGANNASVVNAIINAGTGFDVDGDGDADANDGVMILRRLNGGQTVITGIALPVSVGGTGVNGARTNAEIISAIDGLK